MPIKTLKNYLHQRLQQPTKTLPENIPSSTETEDEAVKSLQHAISDQITLYMAKEKIGFNELVRRLNISTAQLAKILRGKANLTLASLTHIAIVLFGKKPYVVFK